MKGFHRFGFAIRKLLFQPGLESPIRTSEPPIFLHSKSDTARPPERHPKAATLDFQNSFCGPSASARSAGITQGMVAVGARARRGTLHWPTVCLSKKARDLENYIEIR